MKLNKFRLGRSIVYDPWTFQEMAYAPNVMEQKHNIAQQSLMDTDTGLDFEYFEQDDPYVAPKVEALRNKINNVSDQLAKQGVNPQLQNELINLKREYNREVGPQGTLGRASKSYSDAMNQWSAWQKANPKASQQYQEKAKDRFFSGFKGSFDEMGKYQGFSPGSITDERDIMQDFTDFAKETGKGSALQEFIEGKVQLVPTQVGGETFIKVIESTPGVISSNKDQLQGLVDQFMGEYSNKNTDRGLYADIAGLDKNYLASTLSNMQRALHDESYAKQPTWNASVQRIPPRDSGTSRAGSVNSPWQVGFNFPQVGMGDTTLESNSKYDKQLKTVTELKNRISKKPGTSEKTSSWDPRNIWNDIKESLSPLDPGYAIGKGDPIFRSTPKDINTEIAEFKTLYSDYYKPGMSNEDFLNTIENEIKNRQVQTNKYFSMNSKGYNDLAALGVRSDDQFEKIGSGKGKKHISYTDLVGGYKGNTGIFNDSSPVFDDDLNILVQSADDTWYKMKPSTPMHFEYINLLKGLKGLQSDTNITESEIKEYSSGVRRLPGTESAFKFAFDKDDKPPYTKKGVIIYDPVKDAYGKIVEYRQTQIPLKDFIDKAFKGAAMSAIFTEQTTRNP